MMKIDILRHLFPRGILNELSDLEGNEATLKDEIPFRNAHAEIRTQVVVICDPTRY